MAASTCLHPYQNIHTIAGERDAILFDAKHCRGLSFNTLACFRCDLLTEGTASIRAIDPIVLSDIETHLAARHRSPSTSNPCHANMRQFFRRLQRRGYRSDTNVDRVEAQRDDLDVLDQADEVLSLNVGDVMLDCGRGAVPLRHP